MFPEKSPRSFELDLWQTKRMAVKKVRILPEDAREYTEQDWLVYGVVPNPKTRDKLLALTVEEMVKYGPASFNANKVCDRIDAKHALVNYYFGNKEMLIAEASVLSYRQSVIEHKANILAAPRDPEKRLRAFLNGELERHRRMGGWAILVSYPILSAESRSLIQQHFGEQLETYFQYYLAMVGTLILDLRNGTLSDFDFDENTIPKSKLLKHPKVVMDGISLVWSAHGLNVWSAGQQLGSANLEDPNFTQKMLIKHHIDNLVELAKGK